MKSVQKLDEGLYYMEYKGDDGFAGLIEQGGGRSSDELVGYVISLDSEKDGCLRVSSTSISP